MLSGRWSVRSFVSADIPQQKNQQQRRQQPRCTPRCVRRERTRTRRDTPHTPPPDLRIDFDNAQRATTVAAMRLVPSVRSLRTSVASSLRNRATLRALSRERATSVSVSLPLTLPFLALYSPSDDSIFPSFSRARLAQVRTIRARTDTRKADSALRCARTNFIYVRTTLLHLRIASHLDV